MSLLDSILNEVIDTYTNFKSDGDLTDLISEIKKVFKSAQGYAEKVIPQIWDEILELNILNLGDLTELLCELADDLSENSFQTLLETLIKKDTDFIQLIYKAASFCLTEPEDMQKRLSKIWGPLLTVALKSIGPAKIATSLSLVMTSHEKELNRTSAFLDLNLFQPQADSQVLQKMLSLPDFRLPAGVILSGLGLQYLIQKTNLMEEMIAPDCSTRTVRGLFTPIVQSIKATCLKSPIKLDNTLVIQLCMELIKQAKDNEDVEWALLKMARFAPVGIFLIIAAILYCLVTHPLPWWNLLFKEIESDPDLKVKRLPAPNKDGPKYLIFSDIHRDARSDQREPLDFGSFDHFSANQALYCELLDYAIDNGFTVLEAGDCDELWYYRDFSKRPREKLEEIVNTHKVVYDRLVKLHKEGRYVRLYGNHDACVRKPEIFEVLQKIFDQDKKPEEEPFEIYDFAIIEDVKSMDESIINFGLDSEPYKLKMPMIVTHGHQWDFWSCDHNNIIGKLIVSTIGTPIDFLDDPFKDAGGIAYSGSPVINFSDILADAFVLNNFPAQIPARRFAHYIQHLDDMKRFTVDDIIFLETLAALSGETIAVRKHADSEETKRMNLICLGHTHYPQSQPYFNLKKLLPFLGNWLNSVESKISEITKGIIKPELSLIKSRYFNSGTAGWMEGIIWAIQINETGQARLVYWSYETRPDCPQTMDWELPFMDDELRKKLEVKKGSFLNTIEDLSTLIDPLIDSALSSILRSLAVSLEELLRLFGKAPAANMLIESSESLNGPLCHVFLSLLGSEEPKTHTFKIPIPDSTRKYILNIKNFLDRFTEVKSEDRMRLACAWFLVSQSIPFLGLSKTKLKSVTQILPNFDAFLQSILGLIVHLPGEQNELSPIRSRVSMGRNELIIEITTNPTIFQRTRTIEPSQLFVDEIHEQQIRRLWKNIIRLPDSVINIENFDHREILAQKVGIRI
jgi:UDP-2,3-diacylglucosamine pyrophosphatase LpxH